MSLREYLQGMDYGVGIDSVSGVIRGDGVIRAPAEEVSGASGQTAQFHLEKMETTEDLHEALNVSADVDVSFGPFGGGSARFDFAESCEMHGFSVYLLVRTEVSNSFRQMRDVRLKPQGADLLKNGQADRFRDQYGDMFVRGMATGGVFFSVLELKTTNESQQRDVSAAVEASGGLGSWAVSGEFSSQVRKVTQKASLQIRSFQQGGADTSQPVSVDQLVAKASAFAPQVAGIKGVPYEILLQDYRTLDLPPVPNWVDLQNAKEVLQDLWILRNQLKSNLNSINYVLTHQDQFQAPNIAALNKSADALRTAIRDVTRAASRCINKPLEAEFASPPIPPIVLPARKGGSVRNPMAMIALNRNALRTIVAARAGRPQKRQFRVALQRKP